MGKYILHLFFNTNASGQIVGTPTLFYTGIGLYSWQQMNMSNISFNSLNYSSNFTITGINTYGVQIDGFTFGWSSYANFNITISVDEFGRYEVVVIEKK